MGLKLQTEYKGYTAEYWCITEKKWNKLGNSTQIELSCFKDKETRDLDLRSSFRELRKRLSFTGNLTLDECYAQIKEYDFGFSGMPEALNKIFENAEDC